MKLQFVLCFIAAVGSLSIAQDIEGPAISTEGGSLKFMSQGDVVFEAGQGGSVMFTTAGGQQLDVGLKGEKGDMGVTGPEGTMGVQGEPGPPGPPGVISWNQCSWQNLNLGTDYGLLASCRINKLRNETWLRISWNGNLRITRCETCCMRWYFTIDGLECSDPGPIDAVVFQSRNYHIVRQTHLTSVCRAAGGRELTAGPKRVQFSVQDCPGFGGFVYDAYTGWNQVSKIILEEVPPRDDTFPEVAVRPPPSFIYSPNYCHFFFPTLAGQTERNLGTIVQVRFNKLHPHTVLKVTWEGNMRKRSCTNCCSQWWINIDGSPCSAYENIATSISSATAYDIFAPTTLTGVCFESANLTIGQGEHVIELDVGNCPGSRIANSATGLLSTSRLIVEEIPRPRDPEVNVTTYHPQWSHCAIPAGAISEGGSDEGELPSTLCSINKTTSESGLRVAFNGNLRLTDCSDCCMRWFITINGRECVDPAPIDAVLYTINAEQVNIHRGSTLAGICLGTDDGPLGKGTNDVMLNVGMCEGFNDTFNAFTGFNGVSTLNLEELPTPLVAPPSDGSYYPNWAQCVTESPLNSNLTNETVMECTFSKQSNDTVLKVTWEGNIAVEDCTTCCMRWFITIDDGECADPGPIDAVIWQDLSTGPLSVQFDLRRPGTVAGICRGNEGGWLSPGEHTIGLTVGQCDDFLESFSVLTGYNSVSRFIIEEVPDQAPDCQQ